MPSGRSTAAVFAVMYSRILLAGVLLGVGLLAAGADLFWVAFVVGIVGAVPAALLIALFAGRDSEAMAPHDDGLTEAETALAELRTRYARGEYTEAEFEERVEDLLKTQSVPEARSHLEDGHASSASSTELSDRGHE